MSENDVSARAHHTPPRSSAPTYLALAVVAAVWILGCWWSYSEQTHFAAAHQFAQPHLLPLTLDGLAISMGLVAFAASLDARPAIGARVGTAGAVAVSAASNGLWAWERSRGDVITVGLAVIVPVSAMVAFEVLLREIRRQVQRRRGEPAPVRIATPPLLRWVLAFWPTLCEWRHYVLDVTAVWRTAPAPATMPQDPSSQLDTLDYDNELDRAGKIEDELSAMQTESAGTDQDPAETSQEVADLSPGVMTPTDPPVNADGHRAPSDAAETAGPECEPVPDEDQGGRDADSTSTSVDQRIREIANELHQRGDVPAEEIAERYALSQRHARRLRSQARELLDHDDQLAHVSARQCAEPVPVK